MTTLTDGPQAVDRLECRTIPPARPVSSLEEDALEGLVHSRPRSLPPKYFYDARGSDLFDRICDTPEYYPTRVEDALLRRHAAHIVDKVHPFHIVELGAGTSRKTRRLFDACAAAGCRSVYAPFDVCREVMLEHGQGLVADYDWLTVNALVGDYHAGLDHLPAFAETTLYVFLGGTIGNFSHDEAVAFLTELAARMKPADRLLLGADRFKDPARLHAAYNDAAGVTAAFNLNLLEVLNRELEADFDPTAFAHHACFNPFKRRIEMYLASLRRQRVRLGCLNHVMDLDEGEAILTEISRKFTYPALVALLEESGLEVLAPYEADGGDYSLILAGRG
ncbi:MAG: L-histidine N(alpha)-methyltransferase [Gammaproteobacteria bacterium]|nr:L-histidine N(alpha)-methyltransferase [Gammaproteobacteria bacterium]